MFPATIRSALAVVDVSDAEAVTANVKSIKVNKRTGVEVLSIRLVIIAIVLSTLCINLVPHF